MVGQEIAPRSTGFAIDRWQYRNIESSLTRLRYSNPDLHTQDPTADETASDQPYQLQNASNGPYTLKVRLPNRLLSRRQ